MKLRLITMPMILVILGIITVPVYLSMQTGQAAWLILIPMLLGLLLLLILRLLFWGARGGVRDLIAARSEPEQKIPDRKIHMRQVEDKPLYELQIQVDSEKPIASVSEYFLSFTLDSAQIFSTELNASGSVPGKMMTGTEPGAMLDLTHPKLNRLTRELTPAFMRIGGSEADRVFYDVGKVGRSPGTPYGYHSVLTKERWASVNEFTQKNGLKMMFCVNAGPGTRTDRGEWYPENALQLMRHSSKRGYSVDVWELGSEMNFYFSSHGTGEHVPVGQYVKDLQRMKALIDKFYQGSWLAGQGSLFWPILGEPLNFIFGYMPEYVERAGPLLDILTWHYYPQQSNQAPLSVRRAYPTRMLNPENLDEVGYWSAQIKAIRDQYVPDTPIWLGETGNAQFGGQEGVSDVFISGLWWLDQLGQLALQGTQVVVRQCLTGSKNGLLTEHDFDPEPDYWHSLLWKKLMGRQVFQVSMSGTASEKVRVYAHSLAGDDPDSLAVLAINLDPVKAVDLHIPQLADVTTMIFQVQTPDVLGNKVMLNGELLELVQGEAVPEIKGTLIKEDRSDRIRIAPLSYCFICSNGKP